METQSASAMQGHTTTKRGYKRGAVSVHATADLREALREDSSAQRDVRREVPVR